MGIQFLEMDVIRIVRQKLTSNAQEGINMDLMSVLRFAEMGLIMGSMNVMIGTLKMVTVVTQPAL